MRLGLSKINFYSVFILAKCVCITTIVLLCWISILYLSFLKRVLTVSYRLFMTHRWILVRNTVTSRVWQPVILVSFVGLIVVWSSWYMLCDYWWCSWNRLEVTWAYWMGFLLMKLRNVLLVDVILLQIDLLVECLVRIFGIFNWLLLFVFGSFLTWNQIIRWKIKYLFTK